MKRSRLRLVFTQEQTREQLLVSRCCRILNQLDLARLETTELFLTRVLSDYREAQQQQQNIGKPVVTIERNGDVA